MLSLDETIHTLVELGLTVLQAKVYIALAKIGTQTGRAIAKAANVASQDVYRVLSELHEKGLVEKILGKPNYYKSIPLDQGLIMLLELRNNKTDDLKKSIDKVSKCFNYCEKEEGISAEFIIFPAQKTEKNKGRSIFETAESSIDLINNFQESMPLHEYHFEREKNSLDKGVKIREILSYCKGQNQPSQRFLALKKRKPGIQIKYILYPEPAKLIIKDRKEVLISTKSKINVIQQPVLWTNNPILVQIIQQWYDVLWEKAKKEIVPKIQKRKTKKLLEKRLDLIVS